MKISYLHGARLALFMALLTGMTASLSACNTTEGFGKDVKGTGAAIQHTAQDDKPQ